MMSAPPPSRLRAHDFAFSPLLLSVSQVLISNRYLPFFRTLICATLTFAAARAGVSNGFIRPVESNAQPITTVFFFAVAAARPPVVPTRAATTAATAISANSALHLTIRVKGPSCSSSAGRL